MYEQVSHALLNDILIRLNPEIKQQQIRHFYTRLGANFYSIYSLFHVLYGERDDFEEQAQSLVETLAMQYIQRDDHLKEKAETKLLFNVLNTFQHILTMQIQIEKNIVI